MPQPRRFDVTLMHPPVPRPAVDAALLERVGAWCEAGAFPAMTRPFAAATLAAGEAIPITDTAAALDGVACALDGSHALARLGRWRGLAWRVALQWRESRAGHAPRRDDPWDCGWWRPGPLTAATAFRPRRPTLLLVREAAPDILAGLLAALERESPHYRRPVRVLLTSAFPPLASI